MVEILKNKNLATKFQILVEIANSGPNIQQRDIAKKLKVTPQAISDYIKKLTKEGLITSSGRSRYKVTNEGVNWIIKILREIRNYNSFIEKAITNISVCVAIADNDLVKGQVVSLEMKDGMLFATEKLKSGGRGIAHSDTKAGEDVGIYNIEGIVSLKMGKVTILKVPGVQRGGSNTVDFQLLRNKIAGTKLIGGIGIESLIALKKVNAGPVYTYGVIEAAIEAVHCGLSPVVVCVDDMAASLIARMEDDNITYEFIDVTKR